MGYRTSLLAFLFIEIIVSYFELVKNIQITMICPTNQFYDTNTYECSTCPSNMVPRSDGMQIF